MYTMLRIIHVGQCLELLVACCISSEDMCFLGRVEESQLQICNRQTIHFSDLYEHLTSHF